MTTAERIEKLQDLDQFIGTERYYKHFVRGVYADGVKYLADNAGAYWLLDEIALANTKASMASEEFQVWRLKVDAEARQAILTCDDGNDRMLLCKRIEYTDFPLDKIKVYYADGVMLLPSEY